MFKNIIQKSGIATLALSAALAGTMLTPMLADAHGDNGNNGLHLGDVMGPSQASFHEDTDLGLGNINVDLGENASGQNGASIKSIIKPAQTAFKQAVKTADTNFKTAQKAARVQLKASITAGASQADRLAAVKAYFASILAAFHAKSLAIETAFQTFINTNFTINQVPLANAQNVVLTQNSSVNITLTGSDPEHAPLTFILVGTTAHGTLSGTAPNLVYTPSANFTGSDSFTFKVNDGVQNSTLSTVSITVNP